ncbi:hypothetical protein B0H12DRAFT_1133154 [Mycena haematopus]|nr:hypothetical protein B0H12DRAFT_1133154 [Mycena haematopus]
MADRSTTAKSTLELSEDLCQTLDLKKRPNIFKNLKKEIHKMLDQHFDLTTHSCKQPANMQAFVQKTIEFFPGFFAINAKQRLEILEAYAGSYIDENLVQPLGNIAQSLSETQPRIIKVKRPQPRALFPSHKKRKAPIFQTQIESPLLPALPIDSDPPEYNMKDAFEGGDDLTNAPSCCPSMLKCAAALRRSGANEKEHLVGMARWQDDDLLNFLRDNEVAQTRLEEQALMMVSRIVDLTCSFRAC